MYDGGRRWTLSRLAAACCCLLATTGDAAKILGLFPTDTSSHHIAYHRLMVELGERGHTVVIVSHFPKKEKFKNVRDVGLDGSVVVPTMTADEMHGLTHVGNVRDVIGMSVDACEPVLTHPLLHEVLRETDFDLLVTEVFSSECFLSVAHRLGVPVVGVVTSVNLPWTGDWTRNPDNPSYVPVYFLPFSERMSFVERTYNAAMSVVTKAYYAVHSAWPSQAIAEKAMGGRALPPLRDLARNYSLILINSHFSVNQVRPVVPQCVEVGGMHIPKKVAKLPQDIQKFLDESKHGLIYFSLGSIVPIDTFPTHKLQAIIEVFASMKENILWKVNATNLPALPNNVKTSDWLPQLGILCHPSTKVFIGHGGLLGMQEAVYCGVPMLAIPMFADQGHNVAQAQRKGFAKKLSYDNINKKTFSESLNELLRDERYRNKAKEVSEIFKDRPVHPMDAAIYWVEYVLKYNGAHHLKSPALELEWYQYMLLDVTLGVFVLIVILLSLVYYLGKYLKLVIKNRIFVSKNDASTQETNNNLKKVK